MEMTPPPASLVLLRLGALGSSLEQTATWHRVQMWCCFEKQVLQSTMSTALLLG